MKGAPSWLEFSGKPKLTRFGRHPPAYPHASNVRRRHLLAPSQAYADPEMTEYAHLMDGGISDNLALRSMNSGLTMRT